MQPKPSQKSQNDQLNIPPDMKKKIVAKENSGKLMSEVLVHDDLTRKTSQKFDHR